MTVSKIPFLAPRNHNEEKKMKKALLCLLAAAVLAPCAMANSLQVTDAAPLMEGNFYLSVDHIGGSSLAYVQDLTPDDEPVFRGEFLYRFRDLAFPNNNQANFRQVIYVAFGLNPNPNVGECSGLMFAESFRIFHTQTFGGQVSGLQAWGRGRQCGPRNSGAPILISGPNGVDTDGDGIVRVCFQLTTPDTTAEDGIMSLGAVNQDLPCGDAAFQDRALANGTMSGPGDARLATPQANGFGLGETATFDFDSYASFRTTQAQ
ncbi:MAG: hypothetical protein AAFY88_22310 [Acidobacteriota bacterium]